MPENLPVIRKFLCPVKYKLPPAGTIHDIKKARCVKIIDRARLIWGYYSDENKPLCYEIRDGVEVPKKFPPYPNIRLTLARQIQTWYQGTSALKLINKFEFLEGVFDERIKKAIAMLRRTPEIQGETVSDSEILAVFAICDAYEFLTAKSMNDTETLYGAEIFLSLAINTEAGASTSKNIHTEKDKRVELLNYDDTKRILFREGSHYKLTKQEQLLFDYLRKNTRDVLDIIDHVAEEYPGWNRKSLDSLLSELNKKTKECLGLKLIRNFGKGSGQYGISVKIKDKKFEK